MEDLTQQLENIGAEDTQDQTTEQVEETAQNNQVETPQEETTPQELWKQSNQYKQGLWKTPDDIMNSVQYYEKKFQPLEQTLGRLGLREPAQLEQALNEYREKMPVYQQNEQTINTLNALLKDEVYGSKLRSMFNEIKRSQEMARYGMAFDELPQIVQEKVAKGEQAFQQLQELQEKQQQKEYETTISEQVGKVQELAEKLGKSIDTMQLLEYCRDNNIEPKNIYGEFLQANLEEIIKLTQQGASMATTMQQKQNKAKAVNSSTKQGVEAPKNPNTISDLEQEILNKL